VEKQQQIDDGWFGQIITRIETESGPRYVVAEVDDLPLPAWGTDEWSRRAGADLLRVYRLEAAVPGKLLDSLAGQPAVPGKMVRVYGEDAAAPLKVKTKLKPGQKKLAKKKPPMPERPLLTDTPVRFLRLREVEALVGFKKTKIYKLMDSNDFPQSVPLVGRAVGWIESEVYDWNARRVLEARGGGKSV
jgi:prophage regulatory protein